MHKFLKRMEEIAKSPYVELILGVILVGTGLFEAGESLFSDIAEEDVGLHHGIIVLGIAHAIKALPGAIMGIVLLLDLESRHHP